ncbi:MAG: hypothetical protein FJ096_02610 [Deltaproteobacteria bacterium]|nr:hypothetical protein [Deltaproteobacteria bacterium]
MSKKNNASIKIAFVVVRRFDGHVYGRRFRSVKSAQEYIDGMRAVGSCCARDIAQIVVE